MSQLNPMPADQALHFKHVIRRVQFTPDLLIVTQLLFVTFALCITPLADTDFWWHLKTGQLIWDRGAVPRTDWYLFSDFDRPWIDLHWGFQLLIAGLYWLGGVSLVILVKAAVTTAAVGMGWWAAGEAVPGWLRAGVWIPAVICITGRSYERPEMLSQLFLAMWLWITLRVEHESRWIWALPVIQVLWINFHALFVLGLVVGAAFAVDFLIRRFASGRFGVLPISPHLSPQRVFGAAAACAVAALISPYVTDGALFPLELYRKFSIDQEFYAQRIGEFQSPIDFFMRFGFRSVYLNAQLLLGTLGVISFLCVMMTTRRWSPFRLLVFAAFSNLALEASRNVNIFAITAAVLITANLNECWPVWLTESNRPATYRQRVRKEKSRVLQTPIRQNSKWLMLGPNVFVSVILFVWIVAAVTSIWGLWTGEGKPFGLGERPRWFAHEAMRFAGQPGFPDRAIVAHIGLAATYEFHNGPQRKVLLDPRLEVCTQKTYRMQENILTQMARGDRSWESSLRDASGQLPVVILDGRNSRAMINGMLQTQGWRLVYADPAAAIFLSEPQAEMLNQPAADFRPLVMPP